MDKQNVLNNMWFLRFPAATDKQAVGQPSFEYGGKILGEVAEGLFLISVFAPALAQGTRQIVDTVELIHCSFFPTEPEYLNAKRLYRQDYSFKLPTAHKRSTLISRLPPLENRTNNFQIPDLEFADEKAAVRERHPAVADIKQIGAEMIASMESKRFGTVGFNSERNSVDFYVHRDSTKERYWIPMAYLQTPRGVIDQIYQISGKNWFSVEVLRDFFKLLNLFGLKDAVKQNNGENNVEK